MDPKIKNGLIFLAGLITGAVVMRFIIKDTYEQLAQEEINEMKEYYKSEKRVENESQDSEIKEVKTLSDKPNLEDYVNYSKKARTYDTTSEPEIEAEKQLVLFKSKLITPEEFGEYDNYDQVTYRYFADDVVLDDQENVLTDEEVTERFGVDVRDQFGEYEDDAVYFRNEALRLDYEILYDPRKYYDMM